jgi:hypothetical protein
MKPGQRIRLRPRGRAEERSLEARERSVLRPY